MKRIPWILNVLGASALLVSGPACKKKAPEGETAGSAGSAMAGSATAGSATAASAGSADTGSAAAGAAMAGSGSAAGSAAQAAPALSDPQIAAIVVAANQVDIDAGNLALKKTKNAEVKAFAQRMVTDHTAVNKAATDLVTKLKVTPEATDTSKSLTSGGEAKRAELEKLDGAAFDKAYVDNEVAYHEAVIGVLKTQLIPAASNKDLRDALVGVQPAFDAHLAHAKKIQESLAGGGSAAGGSAHDHH